MSKPVFTRILLKISGEGLCKEDDGGIDVEEVRRIAKEIAEVHKLGVSIGMVVGGGNIVRGSYLSKQGVNSSQADNMGMLATVINGLVLQDALESLGVETRVQSAIHIQALAEPYIRRRAMRHLEKNRIVIFASGTGNTHFTTDTAAAQRALEIGADVVIKATKVDGVYDSDPKKNPAAKRFDTITYLDVLNKNLRVMDPTAISLCMENNMKIFVFSLRRDGNLRRAVLGEPIGTLVKGA